MNAEMGYNRKSFLKTLFTGLIATKLALQCGAKELFSKETKWSPEDYQGEWTCREITESFIKEASRVGPEMYAKAAKPSVFMTAFEIPVPGFSREISISTSEEFKG